MPARDFEGESYEICLTTELRSEGAIDPVSAYRALRARNPAPFAALLRLGELSVLSSSPEHFVRVDRERVVESRPMKGTAARVAEPFADACAAADLRRDRKTRAENLLIADLVRNDLGRVSRLGHGGGPEAHGGRVARHRPPDGDRGPGAPARRRRRDRLRPRRVPGRFDDGRAVAAHARDHRPPGEMLLKARALLEAVGGAVDADRRVVLAARQPNG
jgi:hypothetical protein